MMRLWYLPDAARVENQQDMEAATYDLGRRRAGQQRWARRRDCAEPLLRA